MSTKNTVHRVNAPDITEGTRKRNEEIAARKREEDRPKLELKNPNALSNRQSIPEFLTSKIPGAGKRDSVRMLTHGLARTGNTLLKVLDIPNRIFGNTRSRLQDIYEASERNLARDNYENPSAVTQLGEAAVNLATSAGVLGKAMAPVFGSETAASTYEIGKQLGNNDTSSMVAGLKHGTKDTAIWTLVPELASRMLPKSWQLVGKAIGGALAGVESSNLAFDTYRSLGADLSPEEQRQAAVHAAWMVPLLGMLKMGGKRREEAMVLLRKARPDLDRVLISYPTGSKSGVEKVIEVLENEFDDPRSQKIALQWVARKGANLPDDIATIKSALEVASKVKGVDPMQKSPAEFLSNPKYAKFLPKPRPENVKAFSNMRKYPEGVIGFDVKDDAEGRQATREMINAYLSPSANPWCIAKGNGVGKLAEDSEGYWNGHSAVPKQIFFQNIDGYLELLAFRATSQGGEGSQEFWDTSDAPHGGIPIKKKIPGDKLGRYKIMEFRPESGTTDSGISVDYHGIDGVLDHRKRFSESDLRDLIDRRERMLSRHDGEESEPLTMFRNMLAVEKSSLDSYLKNGKNEEVKGTFVDITPGKIYSGDVFRDGVSKVWELTSSDGKASTFIIGTGPVTNARTVEDAERYRDNLRRAIENTTGDPESQANMIERLGDVEKAIEQAKSGNAGGSYVLTKESTRSTKDGISTIVTKKYSSPSDWDYEPSDKPYEITESRVLNPRLLEKLGYDPNSEEDMRLAVGELSIGGWANGLQTIPVKKTTFNYKVPTTNVDRLLKSRDNLPMTSTVNGRIVSNPRFEESQKQIEDAVKKEGYGTPEATTVTFDDRGRYKIAEDVYQVGGDPISHKEYGWLHPDLRTIGNGDFAENLLLQQMYDKNTGLFRTVKSREFDEKLNVAVDYEYDMSGNKVARAYRIPTTVFRPPNPTARADIPEIVSMDRRGEFPPVVLGGLTYGGYVETPDDGGYKDVRESITPDGKWKTDKEIYGSDALPFDLKGGNCRARLDAKGGESAIVRAATKGGDVDGTEADTTPVVPPNVGTDEAPGPRIVVNPKVFSDNRDAACVAWNEAFRIAMEEMSFDPVSEPTEEQRRFFSDTAYADDDTMLRRTIIARICTFDDSVKNPTDEQIQESCEFLNAVLESGAPQNQREQATVQRILNVLSKTSGAAKATETPEPAPQGDGGTEAQADEKGGKVQEDDERKKREAALKKTGAYNDKGTWRDQKGQTIGNDEQAGQYLQALNALKGTNAYYDNGVFRTQTGKNIGGDLESVKAYASINKATQGTGAYYDGRGVWRTQTGKRLDTSSMVPGQKPRDGQVQAGQPAQQQPAQQQPAQQQPAQQPATPQQGDPVSTAGTPIGRTPTAAEAKWASDREKTIAAKKERDRQREERDRQRDERSAKPRDGQVQAGQPVQQPQPQQQQQPAQPPADAAGIDREIATHKQSIATLEEKRRVLLGK